jgi:hypothetical protein
MLTGTFYVRKADSARRAFIAAYSGCALSISAAENEHRSPALIYKMAIRLGAPLRYVETVKREKKMFQSRVWNSAPRRIES